MQLSDNTNAKFLTICEVHRQLYRAIENGDSKDRIMRLLNLAFYRGKVLDSLLRKQDSRYDWNMWEENPEYDPDKPTL